MKHIVLFAPHQDDEVLSAFLYLHTQKQKGNKVSVIFATNGDYKGRETGAIRAQESIKALSRIGITKGDIYFMGYADTGMRPTRSFLFRLYHHETGQPLSAPYSNSTYHPLGGQTVRHRFHGQETLYTKESFYQDVKQLIQFLHPGLLLIPSSLDFHGGHQALAKVIQEIVEKDHLTLPVYSYLIHAGDDQAWPNREGNTYHRPESIPEAIWEKRIRFTFSGKQAEQKKEAIRIFVSQQPTSPDGYLESFAKEEEFFWLEQPGTTPS